MSQLGAGDYATFGQTARNKVQNFPIDFCKIDRESRVYTPRNVHRNVQNPFSKNIQQSAVVKSLKKGEKINSHRIVIDLDHPHLSQRNLKKSNILKQIHLNSSVQPKQIENIIFSEEKARKHERRKSSKQIRQSVMNTSRSSTKMTQGSNINDSSKKIKIVLKKKQTKSPLLTLQRQKNSLDIVLKEIFKKMYRGHTNQTSSDNLDLSMLSDEQLEFVNVLFDKIEPHFLSSINYPTFKLKALQKCPKQLQKLLDEVKYKNNHKLSIG